MIAGDQVISVVKIGYDDFIAGFPVLDCLEHLAD
jgi:hypothetical protein